MSLKTKLRFGLGFVFLFMIIIGFMGSFYIKKLAYESDAIMKDNYKSVQNAKHLIQSLEKIEQIQTDIIFKDIDINSTSKIYNDEIGKCEKYILEAESNITENKELEQVIDLRNNYDTLQKFFLNSLVTHKIDIADYITQLRPRFRNVNDIIYRISEINMEAIVRKTTHTKNTADSVFMYLVIISSICILITLWFIVKFPRYIANPLRKIIKSIKEISNKNYEERLDFKSNDELNDLTIEFNLMAQKLDEYEHSNYANLLFEKKRIESIINNIHDAIIGLNEDKVILFANNTAYQLLKLSENELIGRIVTDVASTNKLMYELIEDLYIENTDEIDLKNLIKINNNDKEIYYNKEIIEVLSQETDINKQKSIGYLIILKNFTKYHELDEAKTNFIATISHELKTPISTIRMCSRLLEDSRIGNMNEEQLNLIKNIKDDTERLIKITDELLDLSQIETGHIKLNFQPESPLKIINYAIETLKFQAQQKKITIETEFENNIPLIYTDIEKTTWVLINLIGNAIRYSTENSKIIVKSESKKKFVIFHIIDNGKGIPKKYKDKIFEKFFKIPDSPNSGSGLGLAICKEFIMKQKGEIWEESIEGHGSTFSFTIPIFK
ncbi:MAG: hypothetical protein A2033_07635 [Bacteroidetes bacterium GWA2_31_9]|nr:MAG: hypothetical protein A2033_07635 [Bacteroidetes bacterium GWA2_31_9]